MGLFSYIKKNLDSGCCCCGCNSEQTENNCCGEKVEGICCIKVLGAGCKSCHKQFENVKAAVKNLGLDIDVEYITEMEKVAGFGVTSMPAIVVNEKVAAMGKVLKTKDVEELLKNYK